MEWQVFRSCLFKIWFTQLCLKSPNVTVCLLPQSKRTCSRVFFSFWFSGFSFWFAVFSFWFSVSDSRSFVSDSRILVSDSRDIWFLIRGILVSDSRILVSDSRLLVSHSLFLIRGKFLIRGLFLSPHYLKAWNAFLHSLKQSNITTYDRDRLVLAILPIFHHPLIKAPMRILSQAEVQKLAGLQDHFDKVHAHKNLLTEMTVRNYCGNNFHPECIQAAVGHPERLRSWLATPVDQPPTPAWQGVIHPKQDRQQYHALREQIQSLAHARQVKKPWQKASWAWPDAWLPNPWAWRQTGPCHTDNFPRPTSANPPQAYFCFPFSCGRLALRLVG